MTVAAPPLLGRETPRLFTPPLRELSKATSLGFEVIAFATIVLGMTLDPWQRWFLVHALELDAAGRLRFRKLLLLVARQNGKTTVIQALTLWGLFTGRWKLAVGTAQDLSVARRVWLECVELARDPDLEGELQGAPRAANGQESLAFRNGGEYIIKASTADAARGLKGVDLLVLDELRTHRDYAAWAALTNTTMARPDALIVCLSNAGDDTSVVLNDLHATALAGTDPRLFLAEYSGEPGCALDDPLSNAQANPSVGYGRLGWEALESARSAPAAVYRTENLCQRVEAMDTALDTGAWLASRDPVAVGGFRDAPMYGGLDVSLDGTHVSLVIGTPIDGGRMRVWVAKGWRNVDEARRELPDVLGALKLRRLGWCPSGPAAELAPVIRAAGRRAGSKRGTELVEHQGVKLAEAAMGLAGAVRGRLVLHQGDELVDAQVGGCARLWQGDRFVFTRRGPGGADAVYAMAFAVNVMLGAPKPRPAWTSEGTDGGSEGQPEARDPRKPRPLDSNGQ